MSINKYSLYRWKWKEYPKNFVQEKVPLNLDLEITTRCNLKCIMCVHSFDPPKPQDMDLTLTKKIIKEFTSKGGLAIKYSYIGEPTLYPHLVELIRYSKENGIIDTRLVTNGTLLTPKLSHDLIEAGLDFITFSVDSMSPHIYKQIRVRGNLHSVIANIQEFKGIRDSLGLDKPKIQIQVIPMELNRLELESKEYHKFYKQFADIIWQSPYCKDLTTSFNMGATPNFFCTGPFQRILVRVNGDIWLCCGSRLESKCIGNYANMNLEDVWNGKFIKKIRRYLNEGKAHLISPCRECEERYYKKGGDI